MGAPRRRPNKTEKLAAVLLLIRRGDQWLVPEPIRSHGTAAEICAAVEFHHDVHHAIRPHNDPRLLTPLSPAAHRARFARDVGAISKVKRGLRKRTAPKPKRLMPYTAKSATHKRKIGGEVVPRERRISK
jgi:hypothetical protein